MADFLAGPVSYMFPLWRGQDTSFVVKRKDPATGDYIDFEEGTTAKIVFVSGANEYVFDAVVDGHSASFVINDDDVVNVKTGASWRLQFTINGRDNAPVVGKVSRKDAK